MVEEKDFSKEESNIIKQISALFNKQFGEINKRAKRIVEGLRETNRKVDKLSFRINLHDIQFRVGYPMKLKVRERIVVDAGIDDIEVLPDDSYE
ncbi:MAG: hypothetical protein PHD51_00275 [Patescibacteria group bacterium]|nr:hypothetical protein [Patescibacteria group bacterium]MDD5490695.1 hypothetical protein [Patescibacteria group bacterium]